MCIHRAANVVARNRIALVFRRHRDHLAKTFAKATDLRSGRHFRIMWSVSISVIFGAHLMTRMCALRWLKRPVRCGCNSSAPDVQYVRLMSQIY